MAPLRLFPTNPHYFELSGKPTVLVSSGEHYGSALNLDFDYAAYLAVLGRHGFNQTRVFSGTYCEKPGDFSIASNNLAPAHGRFCSPWVRSGEGGYVGGGNRFDLSKWDDGYFRRLHDVLRTAASRGAVVELVLFCFFYNDEQWLRSPMHPRSNVNGTPARERSGIYTLDESPLLRAQEEVTRKIVRELNGYDNLSYEIMNEPYSANDGGAFLEWQRHFADLIADTERALPKKHLVAQNFRNQREMVRQVHPSVSIMNFHYAEPEAVGENYHHGLPIVNDETGFKGGDSYPYRQEAWRFMLSGGAGVSHLDYSFTVEHPDGTAPVPASTPGIGGPSWRAELEVLAKFMASLDFAAMRPANELHSPAAGFARDGLPRMSPSMLALPGSDYAIYIGNYNSGDAVSLRLPPGEYRLRWFDPASGDDLAAERFAHSGGGRKCPLPEGRPDVAGRLFRE